MTTYTVTTGSDIVDANDGLTSLREALALAALNSGADAIEFASTVARVELAKGQLTIAANNSVSIHGDRNGDGVGDVVIDANDASRHFQIAAGASVTLDGLTLIAGHDVGAAGVNGADGDRGADGVNGDVGTPGQAGADGEAGGSGGTAAGSILNQGSLVLRHVVIEQTVASGGNGGSGGEGGHGGNGGNSSQDPGNSADRVKGGEGGAGGNAGDGGGGGTAAAIANGGNLLVVDSAFSSVKAEGGSGGDGNFGGIGGRGGVNTSNASDPSGWALDGGGGYNSRPGNAGDAGVIFNYGAIGTGSSAAFSDITLGSEGGHEANVLNGALSAEGETLIFINATDLSKAEGSSSATSFTFHINRVGDVSEAASVAWTLVGGTGVNAADFSGGKIPSGTVTFQAGGSNSIAVTFLVKGDALSEGNETFSIKLSNVAGAELGTSTAAGAIIDDDGSIVPVPGTSGDDVLLATAEKQAFSGMAGTDLVSFASATGAVTASLADPSINNGYAAGDTYSSIEGFVGSDYNDKLTGDNEANVLDGRAGADTMTGGAGSDIFTVDNSGDKVIEANVAGHDLVNSSVTFSLAGQYIEDLTLTGSGNINGTGNTLANVITGNSGANVLDGGKGADTMTGGLGGDTYYVDNAGDKVIEAKVTGVDTVNSSVTFSLAGQYIENLTLTGSGAVNATGNTLDNVLTGNAGVNTLTGGKGDDDYYVQTAGDKAIEKDGQGNDRVLSSVDYALTGQYIERLTLTGGGDVNLDTQLR